MPQDTNDVRGKILRYEPDGIDPDRQPVRRRTARCGRPGCATRSASRSDRRPRARFVTSNGPTGDIGTPATGYDLAFRVEAGGQYQWPACYGYSHLVPGATSCLGRPEPEWSSEQSTIVPTGATWVDDNGPRPVRRPLRVLQHERHAGLHARVAARDGDERPRRAATSTSSRGPTTRLYFSDETKIYRLAAT